MRSNTASDWSIEVCRDRVHRAGEIRGEMCSEWNQYMGQEQHPRQFSLHRGGTDTSWTFVLHTLIPMPVRLSTLFGEWLYLLRSALDALVYFLGVRDSGQNPPPAERSLQFPVFLDVTKYDSADQRGKLHALSDTTYGLLRQVQPFNAKPDHRSNVLWWLEELARIDRHRRGHALAPHIINARIGLRPPLQLARHYLPQPASKPVPIDEWAPMPIINFEAPAEWGEFQVRQHMDISEALTNVLEVNEWVAEASAPMTSFDLGERMTFCEQFVLRGVIDPLV